MPDPSNVARARELIASVLNDGNGPYFDADHPDHRSAVDEMLLLNGAIHDGAKIEPVEFAAPVLAQSHLRASRSQTSSAGSKPPYWPPLLQDEADRKRSIVQGTRARFEVAPNPNADGSEPFHFIGAFEEVSGNEDHIEGASARYGIDPDLVRAIIYVESTQGYYDRLAAARDRLSFKGKFGPGGQGRRRTPFKYAHNTIRPMNVHARLWSGLGIRRDDLQEPRSNIDAGVRIVRELIDRMPNATIAQVATLYNSLAKEHVSDYGARVERIYNEKPWARQE